MIFKNWWDKHFPLQLFFWMSRRVFEQWWWTRRYILWVCVPVCVCVYVCVRLCMCVSVYWEIFVCMLVFLPALSLSFCLFENSVFWIKIIFFCHFFDDSTKSIRWSSLQALLCLILKNHLSCPHFNEWFVEEKAIFSRSIFHHHFFEKMDMSENYTKFESRTKFETVIEYFERIVVFENVHRSISLILIIW
jgi:hypothetical protein